MNLTWHIIKKDLRRYRLPIAVMAGVLVLKTVLLCFTPLTNESVAINSTNALGKIAKLVPDKYGFLGDLLPFVCTLDMLLLIGLVPAIFFEDPTLGDKTYWRTLPIAGWRMLSAKFLTIFLIAWPLQAVLQIVVNVHYLGQANSQYNIPYVYHWYSALGEMSFEQAFIFSLVAMIPLLWRNFAVGSGVLFIVYVCLQFLIVLTNMVLGNAAVHRNGDVGLFDSGEMQVGIWLCAIVAVAVCMYCGRKRLTGFSIFAASVVAIYAITVFSEVFQ